MGRISLLKNSAIYIAAVSCAVAIGIWAISGENALANIFNKQEAHGKLPVKLSEKFTRSFPLAVTAVAWSPDGAVLGVATDVGTHLTTFDNSGHQLSEFQAKGNRGGTMNELSFVNEAKRVIFPPESAASDDSSFDVRDVATGNIVKSIRDKIAFHLAASPDQTRVAAAAGSGESINIYDTADWHPISIAKLNPRYGVSSLHFLPDNKSLLVGTGVGRTLVVDTVSGKILNDFASYSNQYGDYAIRAISVNPQGDFFSTATHGADTVTSRLFDSDGNLGDIKKWHKDNDEVRVWHVKDGKQVASFALPDVAVDQMAWDPKNRFIAFVSNDKRLTLWQPKAGNNNYIRIPLQDFAMSLAISPDGESLAVTHGNSVTVYTIKNN